jgi:DNA helicase-2/ATP-dependent DNA helicase PcrA
VQNIASFLIEVGIAAQTTPLELILDVLIGSKDQPLVTNSPDDDAFFPSLLTLSTTYTSPYKSFYFGKNALKENPSAYINFLSSLRVFIHSLREYKEGDTLRVSDVGAFVDVHQSYNIPLINETPFAHNEHSVQMLTSHGAKGLEFAYVFVVAVNDAVWAGSKKGSKLVFPANLPLTQAGDEEDDFIRLFFVALTRARHTLYLTHHDSPLRFLASELVPEPDSITIDLHTPELLAHGLSPYHAPPFAADEQALLRKVIEGYMLSPTHMNNFLNIIDGGPMKFLEQNILRFPQAMTASSVYGSAVHKALEVAQIEAKVTSGKEPTLASIVFTFTKELKRGRLTEVEFAKFEKRGVDVLTKYYNVAKHTLNGNVLVELNLAKQAVHIEGALLTGKIDKIVVDEDTSWHVYDLKTGKGFGDWEEGDTPYDKLKLHHYKHQLMLYKLLVENSRDYSDRTVTSGTLEFVEEIVSDKVQMLSVTFGGNDAELSRVKSLAVAVYKKIVALDFPDTEKYEKSLKGVLEFEDDLIAGVV